MRMPCQEYILILTKNITISKRICTREPINTKDKQEIEKS